MPRQYYRSCSLGNLFTRCKTDLISLRSFGAFPGNRQCLFFVIFNSHTPYLPRCCHFFCCFFFCVCLFCCLWLCCSFRFCRRLRFLCVFGLCRRCRLRFCCRSRLDGCSSRRLRAAGRRLWSLHSMRNLVAGIVCQIKIGAADIPDIIGFFNPDTGRGDRDSPGKNAGSRIGIFVYFFCIFFFLNGMLLIGRLFVYYNPLRML